VERIVGWAVSYQVIANDSAGKESTKDEKLVITSKAIEYGIEMMDTVQPPTTARVCFTACSLSSFVL